MKNEAAAVEVPEEVIESITEAAAVAAQPEAPPPPPPPPPPGACKFHTWRERMGD